MILPKRSPVCSFFGRVWPEMPGMGAKLLNGGVSGRDFSQCAVRDKMLPLRHLWMV